MNLLSTTNMLIAYERTTKGMIKDKTQIQKQIQAALAQ